MPQLKRQVPDGAIVPGFNDNADIPAKRLVCREAAAGTQGVELAVAATKPYYGVTNEILVSGHMGDVQKAGKTILTAGSGGVLIGSIIKSDGAGKGVIAAAGDYSAGKAETAAAADADFEITLELNTFVHA
jgi:hypothetical protein